MPPPATGQAALSLVRTCFADEIAIDFPSIGPAVERVREMFVSPDDHVAAVAAHVTVTPRPNRAVGVRVRASAHAPITFALRCRPALWMARAFASSLRLPPRVRHG